MKTRTRTRSTMTVTLHMIISIHTLSFGSVCDGERQSSNSVQYREHIMYETKFLLQKKIVATRSCPCRISCHISLPALTDLQSYLNKRQQYAALPQLTLPPSAISCTHFRDVEEGGFTVRCQRLQVRLFWWDQFQLQVRRQRTAEAAGQVELLARNQVCSWGGGDWREKGQKGRA